MVIVMLLHCPLYRL